jgi:hypothetical protein
MPSKVHALAVADDEVLGVMPLQLPTLCAIHDDTKKVVAHAVSSNFLISRLALVGRYFL